MMALVSKIKNNLHPPIIDFMFQRKNNTYNLRNCQEFATKRKRTLKVSLEMMASFARKPLKDSLTRYFDLKKVLGNRIALTVSTDYVWYNYQILGSCSIYLLVIHICNHAILA